MSLGWKTALLACLAVAVFLLNRRARKSRFDKFRDHHTRRKYRIPADAEDQESKERAP